MKKSTSNGNADKPGTGADQNFLNPAGASRRRLMRAVGGSGGMAIAALAASGWVPPVVREVVLPAHAQLSPVEGCPLTIALSISRTLTAGLSISASLLVINGGTTVLESGSTVGAAFDLSASTLLPPGTYLAGVSVEKPDTFPYDAFATISCCNDSVTGGTIGLTATSEGAALQLVVDEGECTIVTPA